MRKRRSRKKGPVNSKKTTVDGINFASGLERYCYLALKKERLFDKYEGETFEVSPGFHFPNTSIERQSNGKGEFTNRGEKKILPIKYTPDFTSYDYIIECKGRANESFPMRFKLFKKWLVENMDGRMVLKPQNQKECDEAVRLILESRRKSTDSTSKDESSTEKSSSTVNKTEL